MPLRTFGVVLDVVTGRPRTVVRGRLCGRLREYDVSEIRFQMRREHGLRDGRVRPLPMLATIRPKFWGGCLGSPVNVSMFSIGCASL